MASVYADAIFPSVGECQPTSARPSEWSHCTFWTGWCFLWHQQHGRGDKPVWDRAVWQLWQC